jgi:hypothetical protein
VDVTSGPRSGYIYIITGEYSNSPAGNDPDIVFHRSTDDGQTWSQGIRVNQDALNNGKNQFFPSICVDTGGGINVLYYDNRNYGCDSSYDVYLSRSTDGGNTWNDYKMSTQSFKPHPVPGSSVYWGDFITIIAVNNKLYCSWMADYTGLYQAWMRIQDITTIGIKQINSEVPDKYSLSQNYPNPFNPSTNIKYQIPNNGFVKLTVFDILGHNVETLVNQKQSAGTYEVEWDGSKYPSGVYFYQFKTESYSQTKKLMLVK